MAINKGSGLTVGDMVLLYDIGEDNSKRISEAIDKALVSALESMGLACEGYAKKECPVDTGRLRNSITHQIREEEKRVYIGTNVEYAEYVELGTSKKEGHPFLKPAAADHKSTYKAILKKSMQNG